MKTLYIDCSMGAAGDMLSGALLDLVPDRDAALAELNSFVIPGTTFHMETVAKCSIASTRLSVLVQGHEEGDAHADAGHSHHHGHHEHRSLEDVLRVIDGLSLDAAVKDDVAKVYRLVAEAESRVHGKEVGEVHFHEVGALDAIADISAFCHLLRRLAPDEVVASPVHVGFGSVKCAHGILPVPAPATAILLNGVPTYSDGTTEGELCTPTGAALVKSFASSFGPQPLMSVAAVGYGAGKKDFERANVVRAVFGDRFEQCGGEGGICELSFNVDDMTGEELSYASGRIFAAGARDVSFAPVFMKKGRPGHHVFVVCADEDRPQVVAAIFRHTSTLGVREMACRRYTLDRTVERTVLPDGAALRRKVATGYGVRRAKWEADDLSAYATEKGISLAEARIKVGEP